MALSFPNKISIIELKNGENKKYYDIIMETIKAVQGKIDNLFKSKSPFLCPFECVILYYLIQIIHNGIFTNFSIYELYNIVDIYSKSFNHSISGHEHCLCKKHFSNKQFSEKNNSLQTYLLNHYEQINTTSNMYNNFLTSYPCVNWLIDHQLYFNHSGESNNFELSQKFSIIGYDTKNVFIVYVKPNVSSLNMNAIIIQSIYDTLLIMNIKQIEKEKITLKEDKEEEEKYDKYYENYEKFSNKKIQTIIFSSNQSDYITFDWSNHIESYKNPLLHKIYDKILNKYIIEARYIYHFYMYYKKIISFHDPSPLAIIDSIITKFKTNKNYTIIPSFINDFIGNIKSLLQSSRGKKRKLLLNNFDDFDFFMNGKIQYDDDDDDYEDENEYNVGLYSFMITDIKKFIISN